MCPRNDASSLRPELAALLAVTIFVDEFVQEGQIQNEVQKTMKIFTDSENAITDMKSALYPSTKNVLENNIDLKMELKQVLRVSILKYKLIHVKAHQDEHVDFKDLPMEAQLNSLVDEYAGGVYGDESCGQHSEDVKFFEAQICS